MVIFGMLPATDGINCSFSVYSQDMTEADICKRVIESCQADLLQHCLLAHWGLRDEIEIMAIRKFNEKNGSYQIIWPLDADASAVRKTFAALDNGGLYSQRMGKFIEMNLFGMFDALKKHQQREERYESEVGAKIMDRHRFTDAKFEVRSMSSLSVDSFNANYDMDAASVQSPTQFATDANGIS